MSIRGLIEIAGAIGLSFAKSGANKKALNILIDRGVLAAGTKAGDKGVSALLKRMSSRSWNPKSAVERVYRMTVPTIANKNTAKAGARWGFHKGTLGLGVIANPATLGSARDAAFGAFIDAGVALQAARAFGAAEKIVGGSMILGMGIHMFSGANRMFEKNIPKPAQELMQTQQMFLPRQAHTQRQRAIQAIHQSQMTTRAALGNEASYMHS